MRSTVIIFVGLLLVATARAQTPILFPSGVDVSPDGSQLTFDWQGDIWIAPIRGGEAVPLTRNPSRDSSPRFSPDGKSLAFTSDRDNGAQVFTMPISGSAPNQVSHHTAGYTLGGWHPDGKNLLVQATRDYFWRHGQRFFLLNSTKRVADQLLFDDYGQEGALSPDGKRVLFVREGPAWWRKNYHGSQSAQIWMFDRDTNKYYPILRHERGCRSPLWKPDGKGFYYTGAQDGLFNLREYDLATGKDRRITNFTDDHVVLPALARDGGTLVFRALAHLYSIQPGKDETPRQINLATRADYDPPREEKRTLTTATEVAFSPDGLEIAFIAGGDLWVMDTELREPRQVTNTPQEDKNPVWLPNGEGILYICDGGHTADILRAERKNKEKYWWQNDSFDSQPITKDGEPKENLTLSPDGKSIAYSRLRGDLIISTVSGENPRKIISSWNQVDYDWSPDGKWLTYAQYDTDFNRDIWILPVDLSKPAFNLSRHPDNESNPRWSPDGKVIAFNGKRSGGEEVDIYYVMLSQEEDEITSRDRKVEKAVEKLQKARGKGKSDAKAPEDTEKKAAPEKDKEKRPPFPAQKKEETPEVKIDWNNLHKRIHRISLPDSMETSLFWSPDSKKLAFTGTVKGERATYAYDFPNEGSFTPKQISSRTGSQAQWLKNGNVVWLSGGLPASFTPGSAAQSPAPLAVPTVPSGLIRRGPIAGISTAPVSNSDPSGYRFQANQTLILAERYAVGFDHCWAAMRDHFYDEKLGNSNWAKVRVKYRPLAAKALSIDSFSTVVNLMLGEINGSHLGFRAPSEIRGGAPVSESSTRAWSEITRHPGVRLVEGFAGPGWKIRDVLPGGMADKAKSRLYPGEVILKIDGKVVQPGMDSSIVLNGPADLPMKLQVQGLDGKEREVSLLATNPLQLPFLLYRKWVEDNQALVEKQSQGKFGYIHISAMDMTSFVKFEEELYAQAAGKDGLVIDVRENGGGSTADHLLTSLTQPVHAIAVPRGSAQGGYPQDRKVYATWNKPIVVLCNQNSFSNAEIFSHAIIALQRGKVVGVPTAGGVISTGALQIMDLGTLRMPFRGWYGIKDGEDMELHGAQPHVVVWPEPGEMPKGIDRQLEKGIEVLRSEVDAYKSRPQPKLRKATDR